HDRAGGGPVRARAAAPAAGPRRAWGGAVVLPADLAGEGGAHRQRTGASAVAGRLERRVRARRARPRAARRGAAARHAPGGRLRPALRPLARRSAAAGASALGGRRAGRLRRPADRGGRASLRRARARGLTPRPCPGDSPPGVADTAVAAARVRAVSGFAGPMA